MTKVLPHANGILQYLKNFFENFSFFMEQNRNFVVYII